MQTMLPDEKVSAVVLGFRMRIVIAANLRVEIKMLENQKTKTNVSDNALT